MASNLIDHALRYARRGMSVLPLHNPNEENGCSCGNKGCESVGKHPRTSSGLSDATTDEETIRGWWRAWPQANIGIACAESGLVVIDIDPRSGGDHNFEALEEELGFLPTTVEGLTGGGGRHILLEHPGVGVKGKLAFGVDVKANGYIVAPPSLHASGDAYRWAPGLEPGESTIAPVPGKWLAALAKEPAAQRSDRNDAVPVGGPIPEGQRNDTLASLAGSMRRPGMTSESVLAALHKENELRCQPPLDSAEVEQIARNICEYPPSVNGDGGSKKRMSGNGKPSQATLLVQLAEDADVFHTPAGDAYAILDVEDHRETWQLKTKRVRRWLSRRFYEEHAKVPNAQALNSALDVLEGRALFDGSEQNVSVRLAQYDEKIYLDLCNERWEAVEISRSGYRIVTEPPVRFRRSSGMLPLPAPDPNGDINLLRQFVNVPHDDGWTLLVAGLVGAISPSGPYPIINLTGEQGSAKSTTSRVCRALIDPSTAPLRSEPRNPRDLMIAANNGWVIALDNLSAVPPWLSDALCRLATGGGYATRELFTDADEVIFDAKRPVFLNGISDLATRSDLLDRALIVNLPSIEDGARREEKRLWHDFYAARPMILGALAQAASVALGSEMELESLPRMADFATFVTRAEPGLGWKAGTFVDAYRGNRGNVHDLALEGSAISDYVRRLAGKGEFEGTATELLKTLADIAGEAATKHKSWPRSASALSGQLKRLAPNLRAVGVGIEWPPRSTKGRLIRIWMQNADNADNADMGGTEAGEG